MDEDLYDEFGNYIGPELDSDEEGEGEGGGGVQAGTWMEEEIAKETNEDEEMRDAPATGKPSSAIVLHEDKKYFPSASEVYPDAETIVQEEDAQPLSEPIIKPVRNKKFTKLDESPACTFSEEYLVDLCRYPHLMRNVALCGHLHHGKTQYMDVLVHQTHDKEWMSKTKSVRYTDVRRDEQNMCISIKGQPMSLVLPTLKEKSYLFNLYDTPGHVNFSDEVTAALRVSDGVCLFVDAVEGLALQGEEIIKHAVRDRLPIVLMISKVDRLILELKMPPSEAYFKLRYTIDEVNDALEAALKASDQPVYRISPELGNVCFSSGLMGWSFTLLSFAKLYATRRGTTDYFAFAKRLWGDLYFNPETRKFQRGAPRIVDRDSQRSFVEFILEPLWKLYSHAVGEDPKDLARTMAGLGFKVRGEELNLDALELLRICLSRFFGDSSGFAQMLVDHVPTPLEGARAKVETSYSGPLVGSPVVDAMVSGDPAGKLMVNICKLFPSQDASTFSAFGRVLSGTLEVGDRVKVLGEAYTMEDEEDMSVQTVTGLAVSQARYSVPIDRATPGMWVMVEGIDRTIMKTATVTHDSQKHTELHTFRPLQFTTEAVVKVAIEPLNPSELPKMLDSLRKVNKTYPLVTTKVEESGEHVVLGTGELYLNCVLNDLRNTFAKIEVQVADPVVTFCETVVETSSVKCFAETPNKKNKLTMIAQPLDKGLAEDIETGQVSLSMPAKRREEYFRRTYDWDLLSSKSVWAFGPDPQAGPNVLMDHTISAEVPKVQLYNIKESLVRGFQWACREGPLCEEPLRNVKCKLLHAAIAGDALSRGGGQVIPTARRVVYSSFLLATPRLMEPVFEVEIQAPGDSISRIYTVLAKRRGHVTEDGPRAGTPLYTVKAFLPVMDSFGFETDLRSFTLGQAFCQSRFHHWQVVPGDPLDKSIVLRPLEPSPPPHLAREFMVKTRRRKGLSEDITLQRFFDEQMLVEIFDDPGH